MNKQEKYVVTINRELGSGGRTVGRMLAEKLGVEFYDKALIEALEKKYNLNIEQIEKLKGQNHAWWAEFARSMFSVDLGVPNYGKMNALYYLAVMDFSDVKPTSEEVFESETEILKGIAESESCVVAGRSGFYVFRDHPNHLNVFIQASMPYRVERVMRKQQITEEEAVKTIKKVDKMRENYVKKYTGLSRYDTRNYDLVISADGKSEEQIVDIIMKYIG
ncbi:MAG: cytidylate kinase-like family protein [Bacteroidales bacterium]|nr:cytidylate kinase-like family protein [Bacteroidales bacterium]MBQ3990538.1 cytidylate kinase-like family protein [Bacteroidales bacterium]MBQ5423606.1 cytidylate kinase-like family protein [Bacteroidales bacterium]